jgi:ankyrin repeat protein
LNKPVNKLKIDSQGRTALHIAAASGNLEVLKYILESIHKKVPLFDAKLNDKQGRNVLHHAACSGVPEVIKYLL